MCLEVHFPGLTFEVSMYRKPVNMVLHFFSLVVYGTDMVLSPLLFLRL